MAEDQPEILDLIDRRVAARTADGSGKLAAMANAVLAAANPDGVFQDLARAALRGYRLAQRRQMIEALALAFGIGRADLKKYLRAYGICNEYD